MQQSRMFQDGRIAEVDHPSYPAEMAKGTRLVVAVHMIPEIGSG
jgi:hypothetical protein